MAVELTPVAAELLPRAVAPVWVAWELLPIAVELTPVADALRPIAIDPAWVACALLPIAIAVTSPVTAWRPPVPAPDSAPPPSVMPLE